MTALKESVWAFEEDENIKCFAKYLESRSLLDGRYSDRITANQSHCNKVIAHERSRIDEIALKFDQNMSSGLIGNFHECFNHQITTDLQGNPNIFDFHLLQIVWTAKESESLRGAAEKKQRADNSFVEKVNQFSMACDADNLGCYENYLKNNSKLIADFRGRYKPSNLTEKQCRAIIDALMADFFENLVDVNEYELENQDCIFERVKIDPRFIEAPMLSKVWRFYDPNGLANATYASNELKKLGKPLESILNSEVLDKAMTYCNFRNIFDNMQQLYPDVNRLRRCLQKHLLDFPSFLGEFNYALKRADNGNDEVGLNCTEILHNEDARIRTHFVEAARAHFVGDKACVEGVFNKQNFSQTVFRVLALGIVEQLSSEEIESEQRLFIDRMADVTINVAKC